MDLPINFPPGTRFWRLIIDVAADLTTGDFMLLDGSIVTGSKADRLRQQIEREAVEISEETFRDLAPPQWAALSAAITERAKRDPEFDRRLRAAISQDEALLKECERVVRDCLQNDPDPNGRRKAAELLLRIGAKKQNIGQQ